MSKQERKRIDDACADACKAIERHYQSADGDQRDLGVVMVALFTLLHRIATDLNALHDFKANER